MERIRLPRPILNFRASTSVLNEQWKIDCFPLEDRMMICRDQLGRAFLFDADLRQVDALPNLHKPKLMLFSLFGPNPNADNDLDNNGCGSSLFIMGRIPKLEANCSVYRSDQFEAFIYRKATMISSTKAWHCELLPLPPYVREPKYLHSRLEISSYAVLGGGSNICISIEGVGTYCMDTARHKWGEIGKWMLPCHGKVEYVPELKLWFGISSEDGSRTLGCC